MICYLDNSDEENVPPQEGYFNINKNVMLLLRVHNNLEAINSFLCYFNSFFVLVLDF